MKWTNKIPGIKQSVSQSVTQTVTQSINQSVSQSVTQSVSTYCQPWSVHHSCTSSPCHECPFEGPTHFCSDWPTTGFCQYQILPICSCADDGSLSSDVSGTQPKVHTLCSCITGTDIWIGAITERFANQLIWSKIISSDGKAHIYHCCFDIGLYFFQVMHLLLNIISSTYT